MTTPTLAEALTARAQGAVLTDLLDALAAAGVDANGFGTFSVERALPEIEAAAQAKHESLRVAVVKGGILDLAATLDDPGWLRRLARGIFRIDWVPALKAVHTFTVTNRSALSSPQFKPRDILVSTDGGILFRSTGSGSLPAGIGQSIPMEFTAEVAGIEGNIGPGEITKIITSPSAITVSNGSDSLVTAGKEDEANSLLVQRCIGRWSDLGNGTAPGFVYRATLAAPSITRVFVRDDNPFGPGTSAVYLANASGPATTTEVALVEADYVANNRKTVGMPATVFAAAPSHAVSVVATLYLNGANANAKNDALAALATFESVFEGGTLYPETIRAILMGGAFPALSLPGFLGVKNVVLSSPTADTILTVGEVLVINASLGVA